MTRLPLIALLAGTVALTGCGDRDEILPGERLDPRAVLSPDGPAVQGQPGAATVALLRVALGAAPAERADRARSSLVSGA